MKKEDYVWFNQYPEGINYDIDPSIYKSVVELLDKSVRKYGDEIAFVNFGRTLSFNEVDHQSRNFASYLQSIGLNPGDRIAIQMPNLLQFPIAMFGALRAGLTVVNTNPLYTSREMEHQFVDSGAKAIVILANFASNLEKILHKTNIQHVIITKMGDMIGGLKGALVNIIVDKVRKMVPPYSIPEAVNFKETLVQGGKYPFKEPEIRHSDIAFLQYTGGTTGVAMGATLTHENIIANMLQIREWMKPKLREREETVITALPLYHIFALTVNGLSMLELGSTNILITNPKDIEGFIKELKKYPFTFMTGVNTLYNALMQNPKFTEINFSHLKFAVAGGMALQTGVVNKWEKLTGTPLVEGYGLSETSPVLTCNPIDGTAQIGTIGLPVPGTIIKIMDEGGNEAEIGQAGEICAKGPQVMKSYWNRDEETKNAFHEGGWFRTGDIGFMQKDGFFKIIDRIKDMIIVSGFNVYPNEIEDVVSEIDGVVEVAAIGVPDEKSSEVVKLYVVRNNEDVSEEVILEYCRKNLTKYKIPKYIKFATELPKTNVGKILRRKLREKELA